MVSRRLDVALYGATGCSRSDLLALDSLWLSDLIRRVVQAADRHARSTGETEAAVGAILKERDLASSDWLADLAEGAANVFQAAREPDAEQVVSRDPWVSTPVPLDAADMPVEIRQAYLDRLQDMERRHHDALTQEAGTAGQGSDEPGDQVLPGNGAPEFDRLILLVICQQLAAAQVCALRRFGGSADDLLTALDRGQAAGIQLHSEPPGHGPDHPLRWSVVAAQGLILLERSRMHRLHAEFRLALYALAKAGICLRDAGARVEVDFNETEGLVEAVFAHQRDVDDWEIAAACRELGALDDLGPPDVFSTEFSDLGLIASGRAASRLTGEDQRDLLFAMEDDSAARRLRTYFFRGTWRALPDKARRALIDADRTFYATTQGRFDSVLAHLQVATQEMCFEVIWKALRALPDAQTADLRPIEEGLGARSPSLRTYQQIVQTGCFRTFVKGLEGLKDVDKTFLVATLKDRLRSLANLRNPAEHDPGEEIEQEEVMRLFDDFLGIGHPGVLPVLARLVHAVGPPQPTPSIQQSDFRRLEAALRLQGLTLDDAIERLSRPASESE